jgi:hypothetical protein
MFNKDFGECYEQFIIIYLFIYWDFFQYGEKNLEQFKIFF